MARIGEGYAKRFLVIEWWIAIVVTLLFAVWTMCGGMEWVNTILSGNRAAIYGVAATVFATLFGFVITAVSIVIGFIPMPRLKDLWASERARDLWQVFTSAIRALAFGTIVAWVGLLFDRDNPSPTVRVIQHHVYWMGLPQVVIYLVWWATTLSLLRLARCVWLLERLIQIIGKKTADMPPSPKARVKTRTKHIRKP